MESMSLVAKAQMGLAQALSALSDVDDGSVEKMAYRATHIGAERSVSILKGITRAFETNFFDTFRFLSVDTMAASSDVVSEIIRIPLQYNASQSRPHLHLVREWSVFRNIRHDLTLVSMWQLANKFSREVLTYFLIPSEIHRIFSIIAFPVIGLLQSMKYLT
jgi:hypothetical protein